MRKPIVGIVNEEGPLDIHTWSGTPYYIAKVMEKYCGNIVAFGPYRIPHKKIRMLVASVYYHVTGKTYLHCIDKTVISSYIQQIENQILSSPVDILIIAGDITYLAKMRKTDFPIVVVRDATYAAIKDFYSYNTSYFKKAMQMEAEGLRRADLCIFSSEWAAKYAVEDYGINPSQIRVIPFGANCEVPEKLYLNKRKLGETLDILFIARRWFSKGGDIAVAVVEELNKLGVPSRLVVIGCVPEEKYDKQIVKTIPFLNKNQDEERQIYNELLIKGHFLLLPTRADCTPIVFCEANAFGLPVITRNIGGISSIINNGKNGYVLPIEASQKDYAELIYNVIKIPENYYKLTVTSRQTYENILNWDVWGQRMKSEIEVLLKQNRA